MNEPGRKTDAAVHRALSTEVETGSRWFYFANGQFHDIGKVGDEKAGSWFLGKECVNQEPCTEDRGRFQPVPYYTTSLAAWKGINADRGWGLTVYEHSMNVEVRLWASNLAGYSYASICYADHNNSRECAQAMARSLCALQWAERSET